MAKRKRTGLVARGRFGGLAGCAASLMAAAVAYADGPVKLVGLVPIDDAQEPATQPPSAGGETRQPEGQDIMQVPLERLAEQPVQVPSLEQVVTTVSRQESTVGQSPTAVFVVTNDMIRRSGATSIPEALRMVPGLQVARIDSNKWAIGSRGFTERFVGKMLVQVDGRTVYNPINAGVYWDTQDLLLQDVDRIEVIRGPGATVWGANAVNGIINIISKDAKDTQGGMIFGGGGTEERGFGGFRYGGRSGDDVNYRVWGKWFERDNGFNPGGDARDDWRQGRGGFRMDWTASDCDTITLQGDLFEVTSGRRDSRPIDLAPDFSFTNTEDEISTGGDVLARWHREIAKQSDWTFQIYYDRFQRHSTEDLFAFDINTLDVDFQQQFPLTCRQQIVYGLGYRLNDMAFEGSTFDNGFSVGPSGEFTRDTDLFSAFVQDEITLVDERLSFTAGSKFEHNDFTGFEVQPTGRVLWTPDKRQSAWASVSRAVRIPALLEDMVEVGLLPTFPTEFPPGTPLPPGTPVFPRIVPNRDLDAEELIAYELGYRAQPTDAFSFDVAAFFNDYDRLFVSQARPALAPVPPPIVLPLRQENGDGAETYGIELAANYKVTECWRLYGQYTFLQMQIHPPGPEIFERRSPHNQIYVQSSWDLPCDLEFDLIGRYVDNLPDFDVDSYVALDARLGWKPCKSVEVAVVGQNLLDAAHPEFGSSPLLRSPLVEVERGVYGMITLKW